VTPSSKLEIAAALITQREKSISVSIDWTLRESARARSRADVKRILTPLRHPPLILQDAACANRAAQCGAVCSAWV